MISTKVSITLDIDTAALAGYSDSHLMTVWHLAQANPAPLEDRAAGELVEHIGREIIRRWLKRIEPKLWHHQGRHHYWWELTQHGQWIDGVYTPNTQATPEAEPGGGS